MAGETFGSNIGYVDELWARYREDPNSVSESWREFFEDYRPASEIPARGAAAPAAPAPAEPVPPGEGEAAPIRGIAARIVENMTESLDVPTATSARTIPVKLLAENRRLINQHQAAAARPRISFTHLIASAVVRALEANPALNSLYRDDDGTPTRVSRRVINLGLAIDVERRGERILLVPTIRDAASLDFPSFVAAYDDLVARARQGKLEIDDFRGTTVSLTNPGMLGTALSVPRLMKGQGAIIGVGAIDYPSEFKGMAPSVISELGLSKVMTVTSTYDHRVIQGAESGAFLATLEEILTGGREFYDRIFRDLGVPHEPVEWAGDQNPQVFAGAGSTEAIEKQALVLQLIRAHRVRGHLLADVNPLGYEVDTHPELELSHYGLSMWDLDRRFIAGGLAGHDGTLTLREILDTLRATYCRHVGVEFMHIQETEPRFWLQQRMEATRNAEPLGPEAQRRILERLNAAEALERFLHATYVGHKRFSLEGAETLIPMLDALLNDAGGGGLEHAVIGMAHRGRLNVLANILGKSYESIFREFEGDIDPTVPHGSGDVKYHLGAEGTHTTPEGRRARLSLASNPSHLEAVDPIVEGMTRALQDRLGDTTRERVLPILIHGDAAFAGQGVAAETLNLSQLKGYRTGGTVHIVINNQIGFTTDPVDARSSRYATDVAKMVQAPIFHVNGDRPEAAVTVTRLALAFRQAFKRDVVVDLLCYRRWGHNEADEPSYTHPTLYAKIENRRSVRKLYTEELLRRDDIDPETAEKALDDFRHRLDEAFRTARGDREGEREIAPRPDSEAVDGVAGPGPETGVDRSVLEKVLAGLERTPAGFRVHPKLAGQLARRRQRFDSGAIDWALAEALAFGSLVLEGTPVRLSGEDSGRGTFSQRHAKLHDHATGAPWVPLAHLAPEQAAFTVFDSLLSEFAVLGFEYGFSVNYPEALVLWEAQFGDFVNGAQVVIDQFIASAEQKWGQKSGLVLLLPHGYEGQGPEHSSARLERFLQLSARGNMQVTYPSTPAQYFHLLRRQVGLERRRPLVILTPKSLLRHPDAVAGVEDLARGGFREVLVDPHRGAETRARRVVFCSGKLYYDLLAELGRRGTDDVALVRIEQLYPYPAAAVDEAVRRHRGVREFVWAQEEPSNMGAWAFVRERLDPALPRGATLRYVGRPRSASPATGSLERHRAEQSALVSEALSGADERGRRAG